MESVKTRQADCEESDGVQVQMFVSGDEADSIIVGTEQAH